MSENFRASDFQLTGCGAVGKVLSMSNANSANTFFDRDFHYQITTIPGHQFYILFSDRGLVQQSFSSADQMFDTAETVCEQVGVMSSCCDTLFDVVSLIVCDDTYTPRRVGYVRKTPFGYYTHLF